MKEKKVENNVADVLKKAIIDMNEGNLDSDTIVPLDACSCTGNLWNNPANPV